MSTSTPSIAQWITQRDKSLAEVNTYLQAAIKAHHASNIAVLKVTIWGALDALTNAEIADATISETLAGM